MQYINKIIWSEDGSETTENIIWIIVLGLGSLAVAFGILSALRAQGAKVSDSILSTTPQVQGGQ